MNEFDRKYIVEVRVIMKCQEICDSFLNANHN